MSYQVLARKYRPQTFAEVVGQGHVTQTLQNALETDRLHHAYLFTGTRGVGKTTVARILAKALNCGEGALREPCNQCESCLEIVGGKSLDVIEIDGASNTGVDDVRQIREQIKYMPARGRHKVYIIDEVHMLSTPAFNALLKTLEEPPAHIVFIFATTEVRKIPATILSRCQQFDFREISAKEIAASLEKIAKQEGVEVSKDVLQILAGEANGSLRDGESLLDQAIAFSGKQLQFENLQKMLGLLDRNQFRDFFTAILKRDSSTALRQLQLFLETGADLNRLATELVTKFRTLLLFRSLGDFPAWLELPAEDAKILAELAPLAGVEELEQLFQLAYRGAQEVARSENPRMVFEVLVIRMTLMSKVVPLSDILGHLEKLTGPAARGDGGFRLPGGIHQVTETASNKTWEQFQSWLTKEKPQLASVLAHGNFLAFDGAIVKFSVTANSMYGEMLKEEDRKRHLESSMQQFFGKPVRLQIENTEPSQNPAADPAKLKQQAQDKALRNESVREAVNILGATVEEVRSPNEEN